MLPEAQQPNENIRPAEEGEQKQFLAIVAAAGRLIYDAKHKDSLLHMLKASGNVLAMAAKAAADITQDLDHRINADDSVVLPAATQVLSMILDLAEEAGLIKMDPASYQKGLKGLMGNLADHYGADEQDVADVHQHMHDFMGGAPPDDQAAPEAPAPQDAAQPQEAPNGLAQ